MSFTPIKNRKIKVALVGCGRISKNHFDSINSYSDLAELVAVCDTDPDALKKATDQYSVNGYEKLSLLLENEELDLVCLCTPSGIHPRQTIECARAGINVLTEKPMATRWEDGIAMVEACLQRNVKLFVVKQNRKNATLALLKRTIDKNRFGKIYSVTLNVFWTRPQAYYDQAPWRGTWALDGGALMNQASHYVDLLDWMIGPVDSIHANIATLARNIEAEDTATLNIKWKSGALGTMNVTMLTYPKNLEGSITILGEKGTVRVGGLAVNKIEHWEFDAEDEDDKLIEQAAYETTSVYGFGHPPFYLNVFRALRGEEKEEVDGEEGLCSLELLIAAYRSAKQGQTIQLPLPR